MAKIKVYLQKPWGKSDSPYYKFLRESSPGNIRYVNAEKFKLIHNKTKLGINNFIKKYARWFIKRFSPSLPNAYFTKNEDRYDLIHCAHCLSKNKKSWVADIEHAGQFWVSGSDSKNVSKQKVGRYIFSKYCKKILAWSEWSRKGILQQFPELNNKVEIVYPAVPVRKFKKKDINDVNLLFIGRNFYLKGGRLALDIMDILTKKYDNVRAIVVSTVPNKILEKYSDNEKMTFYNLLSHEKLFKDIYPMCDIFLYPTFADTFGFAILEAQSFGLPVIATETKATCTIQETIDFGNTGFYVDNRECDALNKNYNEDVRNNVLSFVEKLIKNKKLREKMSKNCFKVIKSGKFSIIERNKKLERIYQEALR